MSTSLCKLIFFIFVGADITACARTYQARYVEKSDFLEDYSLLKESGDDDALLSYWKKGVNWAAYNKIILEPVVLKKLPGSELNSITHAETCWLKDSFDLRLREALRKAFKLVAKPSPGTLVVQYAITDAETSIVILDMFSSIYPSARTLSALKHLAMGTESFVGKATVEGKIMDANTGELLMASVDARAGGKAFEGITDEWDDVQQAYGYWADQLGFQICQRQERTDCRKPIAK